LRQGARRRQSILPVFHSAIITHEQSGPMRSLARSTKFIGVGCTLVRTPDKTRENGPGVGRGRLRYTPRLQSSQGAGSSAPGRCAHHQKINESNRGPFLWSLWKTWKTRNFAGFPVSRHILGIGRWCIARLLKPAERVSYAGRLSPKQHGWKAR